jgi:hypothetical protein
VKALSCKQPTIVLWGWGGGGGGGGGGVFCHVVARLFEVSLSVKSAYGVSPVICSLALFCRSESRCVAFYTI